MLKRWCVGLVMCFWMAQLGVAAGPESEAGPNAPDMTPLRRQLKELSDCGRVNFYIDLRSDYGIFFALCTEDLFNDLSSGVALRWRKLREVSPGGFQQEYKLLPPVNGNTLDDLLKAFRTCVEDNLPSNMSLDQGHALRAYLEGLTKFPPLKSELIQAINIKNCTPQVFFGKGWDLPNLSRVTWETSPGVELLPRSFPFKPGWNQSCPNVRLSFNQICLPYTPCSITARMSHGGVYHENNDRDFLCAGLNLISRMSNLGAMFFAPGQNPLLLNNPQAYKCVVSMTPPPPPPPPQPPANVPKPFLPIEMQSHILSFLNPIDVLRVAISILTEEMAPQLRAEKQWLFNDHLKRWNHDWILTHIKNIPEDGAQRVNNATLCQNMDKASPSILTLQFRSSQGMLLPDTVQMRATIRRHNQGPGTHDPSEMRPLSQWFVDLQELISGGDTIKPHGVRVTCGPVYTCDPLLKVGADLPDAKQFHYALISTVLQELFEHSARESLEFALSPPIPNPPYAPVPRVPHFLENIGSDVWALAKSTENIGLYVGNFSKNNNVVLNLRALLHLNDETNILMSRQEGPDGRLGSQNQSHLKGYLDLRSIEDLYRSLERIAVENFIFSGGVFVQTSSGGCRLNRELVIQCTADELSQPLTFDIDNLLLSGGAYLPKNLSFEKLGMLYVHNAHPVHPEFVWRCQKAGIQNVLLGLQHTHYLPDVLLPLSRGVYFFGSLLLSNVRACQGWLSHCGGTHSPVMVTYNKAHPLALRISCLPYNEGGDYLENTEEKLKADPVRFPAGLSWHQQREILRALRIEGISECNIFKEGVTAEEEQEVSQLWEEIVLTVAGGGFSLLTQKDFDDAPLDKVLCSVLVIAFSCPEVLCVGAPNLSNPVILMGPVILLGGDRSAYANFLMGLWRRDGEEMILLKNLLVNGIMSNHQTSEPEQPAPASDEPSAA